MYRKTVGNNVSQNFAESRGTSAERRKKRFRFENLEVWQEARALNRMVYRLTRRFPSEGAICSDVANQKSVGLRFLKYCGRLWSELGQGLCALP